MNYFGPPLTGNQKSQCIQIRNISYAHMGNRGTRSFVFNSSLAEKFKFKWLCVQGKY